MLWVFVLVTSIPHTAFNEHLGVKLAVSPWGLHIPLGENLRLICLFLLRPEAPTSELIKGPH